MRLPLERTGLSKIMEDDCEGISESNPLKCLYHDTTTELGVNFLPVRSQEYFGRGSIKLRWNGKYGQFSKAYRDMKEFNSEQYLLETPDEILVDP